MRNLKKVLSLALALVMLLGMMMVGAGAATTTSAGLSEANEEAIAVLKATKVMTNKRYGDPVTRAEAAKMVLTIYNPTLAKGVKNTQNSAYFKDVKNHWAAGYIDVCFSEGIISGRSSTVFDPNGSVTGYELGKMILKAMGKDGKYTGKTWTTNVLRDVTALGLSANTGISNWNKAVTRLEAAQLTFNGLTTPVDGKKTVFVVMDGTTEAYRGDDAITAAVVKNMTGGTLTTAEDTTGTLAANFNLTQGSNTDKLGHSVTVWKMGNKDICATANGTSAPVKAYISKVTTVAKDFEGYTFNVANKNYITDGTVAADNTTKNTDVDSFDELEALTANGKLVEVYATNRVIDKIIVVNYKVGKLNVATAANGNVTYTVNIPGGAQIAQGIDYANNTPDTVALQGAVENNDYVTCAVAGGVLHIYPTTLVVGTMGAYASAANTVTVDGTAYPIGLGVGNDTSTGKVALADFTGNLGKANISYYIDQNGFVVASSAPSQAPVTTFAYILDTEGFKPGTATMTNPNAAKYRLKVQAVLADGSVTIYDVKPSEVTEAGKVDGATVAGAAVGDYYVAGVKVWDSAAETANAGTGDKSTTLKTNMFGYTTNTDGSLTLYPVTLATGDNMTVGTTYVNALTADYDKDSGNLMTATKSVLVTGNTTFVVIDSAKKEAHVYTGSLPFGTGKKLESSNTNVVMQAASTTVGTASVVFTTANIGVADAKNAGYAYVDANTAVVTPGPNNTTITSYTGSIAGGATVTLTVASDATFSTSGVYAYNEKNEITGSIVVPAAAEVVESAGLIKSGAKWLTMNESTQYVYVNPALTTVNGNNCVVIEGSGANAGHADIIFVISAVDTRTAAASAGSVSGPVAKKSDNNSKAEKTATVTLTLADNTVTKSNIAISEATKVSVAAEDITISGTTVTITIHSAYDTAATGSFKVTVTAQNSTDYKNVTLTIGNITVEAKQSDA